MCFVTTFEFLRKFILILSQLGQFFTQTKLFLNPALNIALHDKDVNRCRNLAATEYAYCTLISDVAKLHDTISFKGTW